MTPSTRIDLLELITPVAILLAGAYLVYHIIRYVVILINRGIDEDAGPADGSPIARHRYEGYGSPAYPQPADPGLHADSGQLGIDWLCRRACERRERAARGGDGRDGHDRSPIDNRSSIMAGVTCSPDGRPCGPRLARAARPVVVVQGGAFAGARVRVLFESRELAGVWFVEVVDGAGRGDVAVVAGDWL